MKHKKMNKKVLVFGTFDVLHPGHLNLFEQARKHGEELHVVVARDETVEQVKGSLPAQNERTRLTIVAQAELVDHAYLGYTDDKYKIIEEIHPDVIALGYDQDSFVDSLASELKKRKINTEIIRLEPYRPELYKSSKIKAEKTSLEGILDLDAPSSD